jgi:hypothetical protein
MWRPLPSSPFPGVAPAFPAVIAGNPDIVTARRSPPVLDNGPRWSDPDNNIGRLGDAGSDRKRQQRGCNEFAHFNLRRKILQKKRQGFLGGAALFSSPPAAMVSPVESDSRSRADLTLPRPGGWIRSPVTVTFSAAKSTRLLQVWSSNRHPARAIRRGGSAPVRASLSAYLAGARANIEGSAALDSANWECKRLASGRSLNPPWNARGVASSVH